MVCTCQFANHNDVHLGMLQELRLENESLSSSLKRVMELETALEQKEAANVLSKLELEKLKGATVCSGLVVG